MQLLMLFLLLGGVFGLSSLAEPVKPLTIGFVPGSAAIVREDADARRFTDLLAVRLKPPVKVKLLDTEKQLHLWVSRFREVDCGWFSDGFLQELPAGELLPLAMAENTAGVPPKGRFVVHQGIDAVRVQQLREALLAFGSQPDEAALLKALGIARFVAAGEQPRKKVLAELPISSGTAIPATVAPAPAEIPPVPVKVSPEAPPAPSPLETAVESPTSGQLEYDWEKRVFRTVATVAAASGTADATPVTADAASGTATATPVNVVAAPVTADAAVVSPSVAAPEAPVTLAADQIDYDWENRVFRAGGGALLQQGDTTLAADELLWQDATRDAVASGNVRLTEPSGELQGSSLRSNLTTGLGLVTDGRALLKERNFHLAGAEIERLGEATYRVTDGRFTTCDGDNPDWQFSAGEVDVNLGGFAVAREVWFEAGGQPLFYLPYLLFPVKSERESGFLLPRVGYSSRKGAVLSLAWYEVIDRHLDATVYIDVLSRLGFGKGLEYRYALGGGNRGKALLYHVSGIGTAPDSFAVEWQHDGMLPGGVRLAADVEYVDKKEFFEDFGEAAEEYNRNQTVSTILLQRNWDKLNLTGHARYIHDLDSDNDLTLQRLPELGLGLPFYRLETLPLYAQTEARATSFHRSDGEEGSRLYLRQGLNLVFKPGDWLEFVPGVAVYGRYYHADGGQEGDLLPEYSATLSTRLLRTFPFSRWGIEKLQHSIEPQVSYTYIPNSNQADLPVFDLKDRIGPLNLVEYALINRFTARSSAPDGTPTYREVLNLRFSQTYDVREERDNSVTDPEPFSDLRTELMVRPTLQSIVEVDALTRVHGGLHSSRLSADVGYDDDHGDLARIGYHFRDVDLFGKATDYLRAELATSRFAPIHLILEERYDFEGGNSLESLVGLEYRAKCWSLFLTFRDRPDSQDIMVGFALSGLGQVGGFGSALRPLEQIY